MDLSQLLEALDTFLEAASRAEKERVIKIAEAKLERFMSGIFSRQGKAVLAANAKYKSAYPLEESLRPEDMERIIKAIEDAVGEMAAGLVDITGPVMEAASQSFLDQMIAGLDPEKYKQGIKPKAFTLKNPDAVEWLEKSAKVKVAGINETTREQMRGLLAQSIDEGWSYNRTAKAIKERFDGFAGKMPQAHIRSRAEGIAVTESRDAYEQANLRTARSLQEAGLEMEKSSLISSSRVCDDCKDNASKGWIGIDEDFPHGGNAPPFHPYCRCDLLMQMKED